MAMYKVQEDRGEGKRPWWLLTDDDWLFGTIDQALAAWRDAPTAIRRDHPNAYILGPSGGRYSLQHGRCLPANHHLRRGYN